MDEPGKARAHRFRTEAEAIQRAGREVLHEDIRFRHERFERIAAKLALHIERDALLRAIGPDEMARKPARAGVVGPREIAAIGPLDLDDPRAVIREHARAIGCGDRLFERDDQQTVERADHVAFLLPFRGG